MISDRQVTSTMIEDEQLRQRLRAVVLTVVPNKWALRATLFRLIDRAPPSVILSMRDHIRELVKE